MRSRDDQDAWETLHRGTDREEFDSPGRFELSRVTGFSPAISVPATPDVPPAPRGPVSRRIQLRSRVRPYARTGGRTRSDHDLAIETLISTSEKGQKYSGVGSVEHRAICDLCIETRSVAEIAAHLRLPLGVVKILVGDMSDAGLVVIHQTGITLGDRSSREFMERVLQGLRAL
ncbi:DUF742 domain-containing protein [Amycolatopsis sp. NPDC059657]|uniref:DUF742 domain-containing protein n=1 Tax=Amycolatopsis sp. NPDC059657 TaxID=3346899 RepID=UPI00366FD1B5